MIYVVGCKLDLKVTELKLKTAYIIDNNQRFTSYGQRIKTFVETTLRDKVDNDIEVVQV